MTMGAGSGRSPLMSEAQFREIFRRLGSTVPWGPDDRRGGLNYITPAQVLAAASEVRLGRTVSLAAPIEILPGPDNPEPAGHQMTGPTDRQAAGSGLHFARDRLTMNIHGDADSHLDALCHVIYDGSLYNSVSADTITPDGATELSVDGMATGTDG